MRHRLFSLLGLLMIGLAIMWYFLIIPGWQQRIPPGWTWDSELIGTGTSPDPATGQFPQRDTTGRYYRMITSTGGERDPHVVELEDHYIIRDAQSQQVSYEYIFRAAVNQQTGEHLDERYRGEYFVFPRNTQPITYRLRNSYLKGVPVSFQHLEAIEGVRVYKFGYKGRGEYSESYAGTDQYPGINVAPGQEIRCADDQFTFQVWVEPVTGEVLKVDESCYSGDYVYDIATNTQLGPVYRWAGITTGDDIIQRADQARRERQRYLWVTRYLPWLLLTGGLLSLIAGLVRRRASQRLDA